MQTPVSNSGRDETLDFDAFADLLESRLPGFVLTWLIDPEDEVIAVVAVCGRTPILLRLDERSFTRSKMASTARTLLEAIKNPGSVARLSGPKDVIDEIRKTVLLKDEPSCSRS